MWEIGGKKIESRFFLGTAQYPSPEVLKKSIEASATDVITVSIRRENPRQNQGQQFWEYIKNLKVNILPNTSGCYSADTAVKTAKMARDLFGTNWVKLEVIGNKENLQPHPTETVEAARILVKDGFEVFPYTTADLVIADQLVEAGCRILMPWASPIGSAQGLRYRDDLIAMRSTFPEIRLVVDAGLRSPSEACEAMELGFDAVLLNTAVAKASDPVAMAAAFAATTQAGYSARKAGLINRRHHASPSSPLSNLPFWHQSENAIENSTQR